MELKAKSLEENLITIDIEPLRSLVRGKIITPTDSLFDEERKVWNAAIDRRPAFIVQCKGTADVIHAVEFAHQHQLLITVRGGGHNVAGRSIRDNVMLIDLSKMRAVHVDPIARTATVEPGATLGDVDHETQIYGLGFPVGINSTTGISGLTLGGGFGWISRKWGLTVDHLLAAEVITVDGKRLMCSEKSHQDLFWALRGGGGNFGIITKYFFRLSPVGPKVLTGMIIYSIDDLKGVMQHYCKVCRDSPEELCVCAVIRHAPAFDFLDPRYNDSMMIMFVYLYCGDIQEGQKVEERLFNYGKPLGRGPGPDRFLQCQRGFDFLFTPGFRNYWKSHNFKEIPDGMIDVIVKHASELPSKDTEVLIIPMGGRTTQIDENSTAYPHRQAQFIMNLHTRWDTSDKDAPCIQWARDFFEALTPFAMSGTYVNFISEGDESTRDAYGPNVRRLAEIKAKYDPHNVLRSNINISPQS